MLLLWHPADVSLSRRPNFSCARIEALAPTENVSTPDREKLTRQLDGEYKPPMHINEWFRPQHVWNQVPNQPHRNG